MSTSDNRRVDADETILLIGRNLLALADARDMTQGQFAAHVGVSPQWLSQVVNGTTWPGPEKLRQIAEACGIYIHDLFDPRLRGVLTRAADEERALAMRVRETRALARSAPPGPPSRRGADPVASGGTAPRRRATSTRTR
jgi:transcriptional regulator with XRE-family HTH domain